MAKKIGNYEIPFDNDGNQLHYPQGQYKNGQYNEPVWIPNYEFEDTLIYDDYSRGRSAAYFNFKRSNGKYVTVFLAEMNEMIPHMIDGAITGKFKFIKRGTNYGTSLIL